MEKVTLKIEGMHCPMCESHVCDAIRRALPVAKKVKASHRKGEASFVVEEGVVYSSAVDAVAGQGYRVLEERKEPAKPGFFHFGK